MRAVAACFFLFFAAAFLWPAASTQNTWKVITSKEGGFSVEMPAEPSINKAQTRKTSSGTLKTILIGCKSESGIYLATRTDYPTAIVKGTEEKELNEMRDYMALAYGGKVISEKKVRADGRIGRDFTIRTKDEDGVMTIRLRAYLSGKSIYSVYVISAPNRELPEDTGRFLGSLALGPGGVRAAGKPEPEPTGTELKGWGLAIDPAKDCQFMPTDKSLSIKVPGTLHDLSPDAGTGRLNSPRVVNTVDGNFIITAKVTGDFKPSGPSTNPKGVPFNGGGILIWNNSDNFIRLERGAMLRNKKVLTFVVFEEREAGYRGAQNNEVFPSGDCYLRIERRGSRIYGGYSFDNKKWKKLLPIDTLWPSKLKVGLSATNSSSTPCTVRFEEFTLKRGEL